MYIYTYILCTNDHYKRHTNHQLAFTFKTYPSTSVPGAKPTGMRWFWWLSGRHSRAGHCLGCAVTWPWLDSRAGIHW